MEALQDLLDKKTNYHYIIVLFTYGDELEDLDITIQQYLLEAKPELRQVIQSCGNRFHVFNNRSTDTKQVEELITKIDDMVAHTTQLPCIERWGGREKLGGMVKEYRFISELLENILRFNFLLKQQDSVNK